MLLKRAGLRSGGQGQQREEIIIQEQNIALLSFLSTFHIDKVCIIASFSNQKLQDLAEEQRREGMPSSTLSKGFSTVLFMRVLWHRSRRIKDLLNHFTVHQLHTVKCAADTALKRR